MLGFGVPTGMMGEQTAARIKVKKTMTIFMEAISGIHSVYTCGFQSVCRRRVCSSRCEDVGEAVVVERLWCRPEAKAEESSSADADAEGAGGS